MKVRHFGSALAVVCLAAFIAPVASAQTIAASNTVTQTNTASHVATVTIDRQGNNVLGFLFELQYNTMHLSLTPHNDPNAPHPNVTTTGTGAADFGCVENVTGVLRCIASTSVTSATYQVMVSFAVGATEVPPPGSPLTFVPANTTFTDDAFNDVPFTTVTNGSVTITGAPVVTPPTLTGVYTPRAAASGVTGTTVIVGDIDFSVVTPAANGGTGSITCVDTDAANPPVLTINPANQTGLTTTVADATVSCGLTLAVQNGSVQCTLVNGGVQTYAVTCPAGSAVPPIPVPPTPAIIPASSMWSQLSLIGLLAALGLLVVALRRNH